MITTAIPGMVQEVRRYGTFDANACLNCGSCSVVCELSGDGASFPRVPIQRTVMGLKDSVRAGLEPWLCHDCGDCSIHCPRQAAPRESMMTLRRYLAGQYDFTGISSRIFASKLGEVGILLIAGLATFALAFVYHLWYKEVDVPNLLSVAMGMEHMFPTIAYFTIAVFVLPLLILLVNSLRMHRFTMHRGHEFRPPLRHYLVEAKTMLFHLFTHRNMRRCPQPAYKKRWMKHVLLGTAITVKCVIVIFFLRWFQTDAIYPLSHPQRWLGYLVTAAMLVVSADLIVSRLRRNPPVHSSAESGGLVLPVMIFLVALSGIGVHVFRYLEFPLTAHFAYAVHLAIAVPLVLVELPFGKWSHVVYRPLALYFQAVRERAMAEERAGAVRRPSQARLPIGAQSA